MRRLVVPFVALAAFATPLPAMAYQAAHYTPAALQAAQASGKPIVVHVTASWCSTCAAQKPIIAAILKDPRFKDLVLLDLDFDSQKDALRQLNVNVQSTFVAFKGKTQVARSSGDTEPRRVERLFEKTITK